MSPTRRLTTPRAAGLAGVLFTFLFGAAVVLIRTTVPESSTPGDHWVEAGSVRLRVASLLMPFAGICFLWFIGVVRDGLGRHEDRFFASVFLGSGLLFLAMLFASAAIGTGLVAVAGAGGDGHTAVIAFGQAVLLSMSKTYGLRMAAVFMFSLGTIWHKTQLMPRWLVGLTYGVALCLLLFSDVSMWIVLAFPAWVLVVSLLALGRAGVIDLHLHDERPTE